MQALSIGGQYKRYPYFHSTISCTAIGSCAQGCISVDRGADWDRSLFQTMTGSLHPSALPNSRRVTPMRVATQLPIDRPFHTQIEMLLALYQLVYAGRHKVQAHAAAAAAAAAGVGDGSSSSSSFYLCEQGTKRWYARAKPNRDPD